MTYDRLLNQALAVLEHIKSYGAEPLDADPAKSDNLKRAKDSANRLVKMIREEMEEG